MIDQPYQARLIDGMVRCYVVGDTVAGFGEQLVDTGASRPSRRTRFRGAAAGSVL
jgi:hypothetical protein